MYITGTIAKCLEKQTGTSQRTGNAWESQEFIIEYFEHETDRFPDRLVFKVFGAERLAQWNIQQYDEVKVGLGHRVNEYNGKFYNEISAFSCEHTKPQNAPADEPSAHQPADSPQPQSDAPQGDANGEGGKGDDLPF
jgi:hypothetical protein